MLGTSEAKGHRATAIIDKSFFQRICEQPSSVRRQLLSELKTAFDILVPFVLVEEVLVNRGQPGAIPRRIIETMFRELMRLRDRWVDDEPGWIFVELVQKQKPKKFKPASVGFLRKIAAVKPCSAEYQEFIEARKTLINLELKKRIELQNEAAEWQKNLKQPGEEWFTGENGLLFCLVETEEGFFQKFVNPGFAARHQKPELWYEMLNHSLGKRMRDRFPAQSAEIEAALRQVSSKEIFESPVTFAVLISKLFYFWAPLVRIGNRIHGSRRIIGRSESDQRGNVHDERYIAMSLLCNKLITRDADMGRMAATLCECGLWKGTPVTLGGGDVRVQVQELTRDFFKSSG